MDIDSFVLSVNTKNFIIELKNLEDLFDFSNLRETHELFSYKNKKDIGKFKIITPKNFWIDEFICLRSKMCIFNCGDDSKNKLNGISKKQPKNIKFKNITIVFLEENINKNVIIILFDHLIMKCIFNE